MAIWIQSLSWTLIYSLGQGIAVYASLWLVLKLLPATSSAVKYHLSLSALTILLAWFVATWWQQYHDLSLAGDQIAAYHEQYRMTLRQQIQVMATVAYYGSYRAVLHMMLPWFSTFYFTGFVLMLVRLSVGMLHLFSLRSSGLSQPDAVFSDVLTALKSRLQLDKHVRLFLSAKAQVPMVVGFLKPMILMPAAAMAQLSMEQLETILLHELAHIKRYDYLVNILQTVVETILFFNPFVWLVSAIIRREREHCCDDLVLDHTREPLSYATALAALAARPGTASVFTVAASGQSDHLFNRIKRIMEMKKNRFSYSRMAAAILIIAGVTCSIAWLRPAFDPKKDKPNEAATTTIVKPVQQLPADPQRDEANLLVQRLSDAQLVSGYKGFIVEKVNDKLVINGKVQIEEVARQYLSGIKQAEIRVQVSSFNERLKQHPDASILQLLAPTTFSSGCVDYKPKKEGC